MSAFVYKAVDKQGRPARGALEAANEVAQITMHIAHDGFPLPMRSLIANPEVGEVFRRRSAIIQAIRRFFIGCSRTVPFAIHQVTNEIIEIDGCSPDEVDATKTTGGIRGVVVDGSITPVDDVSIVDTKTHKVIKSVPVGRVPHTAVIDD